MLFTPWIDTFFVMRWWTKGFERLEAKCLLMPKMCVSKCFWRTCISTTCKIFKLVVILHTVSIPLSFVLLSVINQFLAVRTVLFWYQCWQLAKINVFSENSVFPWRKRLPPCLEEWATGVLNQCRAWFYYYLFWDIYAMQLAYPKAINQVTL